MNIHSAAVAFMNGLTYAGLLFMIASGFTLVFGLMRVVNLSHGVLYLIGAYVALSIQRATGQWVLAVAGAAAAVAVLAYVLERGLLKRVQGNDLLETLLTLGVSFVLADIVLGIYGGLPQSIRAPAALSRPVNLGLIYYPSIRLFVLGVAVIQGFGLWLLMHRTHIGRIIRAGVDNRAMVSALGINIDVIFTAVFALAGLLTGISGAIGGSYLSFSTGTDMTMLTFSLIVVIVGGMGSLPGAALGALLVGMVDSFTKTLAPELTMVVLFGVLMIVLAFRPRGLLGRD